jgi:hypothetical protein
VQSLGRDSREGRMFGRWPLSKRYVFDAATPERQKRRAAKTPKWCKGKTTMLQYRACIDALSSFS